MNPKSIHPKREEELKAAIQEDNDYEASEILADFGNRWFGFGILVGIVITCLAFGIINKLT